MGLKWVETPMDWHDSFEPSQPTISFELVFYTWASKLFCARQKELGTETRQKMPVLKAKELKRPLEKQCCTFFHEKSTADSVSPVQNRKTPHPR